MKNRVTIIPSDNLIIVDDIYLEIYFYPSKYFHAIQWYKGKGQIEWGETIQEIYTEEDYNTFIAPYITLWQAEFERLAEEKKQSAILYNSLSQIKERKLQEIKYAFLEEQAHGFVASSLGFNADATRTSKQDIDGLIQIMEISGETTVLFRDYENTFYPLKLPQLKILQGEIIQKGLDLYQKKWLLENQILNTINKEEIEAIKW